MDHEAFVYNQRIGALAEMCDNAALAILIAAAVKAYNSPDGYVLLYIVVGIVLIWAAWHVRGLLQPEF